MWEPEVVFPAEQNRRFLTGREYDVTIQIQADEGVVSKLTTFRLHNAGAHARDLVLEEDENV